MKKIYLFLALLPLVFIACSSDSDDAPEVSTPKEYKVVFTNHIDASKVSQNSDGKVYDINLVSQDGNIYHVLNTLYSTESYTFTLPSGYDKKNTMFLICKFGRNHVQAAENNYWAIEESYGKLLAIPVYDDRASEVFFTEETKYSSFPYSKIEDFKNMLQSILSRINM